MEAQDLEWYFISEKEISNQPWILRSNKSLAISFINGNSICTWDWKNGNHKTKIIIPTNIDHHHQWSGCNNIIITDLAEIIYPSHEPNCKNKTTIWIASDSIGRLHLESGQIISIGQHKEIVNVAVLGGTHVLAELLDGSIVHINLDPNSIENSAPKIVFPPLDAECYKRTFYKNGFLISNIISDLNSVIYRFDTLQAKFTRQAVIPFKLIHNINVKDFQHELLVLATSKQTLKIYSNSCTSTSSGKNNNAKEQIVKAHFCQLPESWSNSNGQNFQVIGKQKREFNLQMIGDSIEMKSFKDQWNWRCACCYIHTHSLLNQTGHIIYSTDIKNSMIRIITKERKLLLGKRIMCLSCTRKDYEVICFKELQNGFVVVHANGEVDGVKSNILLLLGWKSKVRSYTGRLSNHTSRRNRIKKYNSRLIVGDENFSYTSALIKKHEIKYPELSQAIITTSMQPPSCALYQSASLSNAKFYFGVDPTQIQSFFQILSPPVHFSRIHWISPFRVFHHQEADNGACEEFSNNSAITKKLGEAVCNFFKICSTVQRPGDRIYLTFVQGHKSGEFWKVRQLQLSLVQASTQASYRLIRKRRFNNVRYPGYQHCMGGGLNIDVWRCVDGYAYENEFVFEKTCFPIQEVCQFPIYLMDPSKKVYELDAEKCGIERIYLSDYYFDCSTDEDSSEYEDFEDDRNYETTDFKTAKVLSYELMN